MKSKRLYIIAIFLLLANLIYRLIDQSQMIWHFPMDYVNDVSSYMAQLYFLNDCGFLNHCAHWYNGFISFQVTPPGWFFFASPFHYLLGDVKIATYVTIVLSLLLAFIIIYRWGKYFGFSKVQRWAFFLFMFANALAVGSFIRLGRVHELFSWVWFLFFAFLVIYYRNKGFDRYSLLIIPTFSLILFSYQSVGILASLLFLSLFLVKDFKEKIFVVFYFVTSLLLISFWLVPFLYSSFSSTSIGEQFQNAWLWQFTSENLFTNIAAFLIPLALFVLFYLYWKSRDYSRKELYFFIPVLLLNLLYFFRLTPFVPVFRNIFPDPYLTFFLFFILFFFFSLKSLKVKSLNLIPIILILFSLISVGINFVHTPEFVVPDRVFSEELNPLFSNFEGSFLLFGDYSTAIYGKAVYSYVPIYYNITTPFGWYPHMKDEEYLGRFYDVEVSGTCVDFIGGLNYLNTTHVIGYTDACDKFEECRFDFVNNSGDFCLYKI